MIDSLHLYLTASQAQWRRQTGLLWRKRVEEAGGSAWDSSRPSSLLADTELMQQCRGAALYVYVGSALCRFMVIDLPAACRNADERQKVGQSLMVHQLGLDAMDWEFSVDPVQSSGQAIMCAIRKPVLTRIVELATENKLRLVSLRPYVAGVRNILQFEGKKPQESCALFAIEGDAFTVIVERNGMIAAANALPHDGSAACVEREVRRASMGLSADLQGNLFIAQTSGLRGILKNQQAQVVRALDYYGDGLHKDFRDLLFEQTGAA